MTPENDLKDKIVLALILLLCLAIMVLLHTEKFH